MKNPRHSMEKLLCYTESACPVRELGRGHSRTPLRQRSIGVGSTFGPFSFSDDGRQVRQFMLVADYRLIDLEALSFNSVEFAHFQLGNGDTLCAADPAG